MGIIGTRYQGLLPRIIARIRICLVAVFDWSAFKNDYSTRIPRGLFSSLGRLSMNREFKFNLDKIEETGVFYGTAAVYGNVDLGGDVIEAGAFTKSIAENGGKVPLLLDHRIPIGLAEIEDTPFGLKTRGVLNICLLYTSDA